MQTKNLIAAVVASSLISSLATGLFIQRSAMPTTPQDSYKDPAFSQNITRRLANLETEIAALRRNSQTDSATNIGSQAAIADEGFLLDDSESVVTDELDLQQVEGLDAEQSSPPVTAQTRSLNEVRRQRLVAGGFSNDEATWILQAESDVTLERLYDQYESRRARLLESENSSNRTAASENNRLRQKLGDDYYERYLEANGWPTKVSVGSVIPNSPGFDAGLRAGDQVKSYNGQRVFNVQDINNLSARGTPGESVLIEVERDGNPVQITVPRGPIGIIAGRGPNRRQ